MTTDDSRYIIEGVDVSDIRNRNEVRIIDKMREVIAEMDEFNLSPQGIRDAYALALNLLPARYKQSGTIVLREPVRETHLREAAARALKQVISQPKT